MKLNAWRKTIGLLLEIAVCSYVSFSSSLAATDSPRSVPPPAVVDYTRLQFSPGILDIVRMVKANVNPEVIKLFINRSPISYKLSAQEVIALKRLGVSNDIILTIVGHPTRALDSPQAAPHQGVRIPGSEDLAMRAPPQGGYMFHPHPVYTAPVFGTLTSFNNSYPTFVNGQPVYSGYYLQSYPVW